MGKRAQLGRAYVPSPPPLVPPFVAPPLNGPIFFDLMFYSDVDDDEVYATLQKLKGIIEDDNAGGPPLPSHFTSSPVFSPFSLFRQQNFDLRDEFNHILLFFVPGEHVGPCAATFPLPVSVVSPFLADPSALQSAPVLQLIRHACAYFVVL